MSIDSHDPSALIDIEDLVTGKNEWLNMYGLRIRYDVFSLAPRLVLA